MRFPSQRWLKLVLSCTALLFATAAIYIYGVRWLDWVESDAAVTALLGDKVIAAKLPVVADWFYVNGDVWLATYHLFAVPAVLVLGLGLASLLVAVVIGFVLELYAFTRAYAYLAGERWIGVFAALVTMAVWSNAHASFVYAQLSYGWVTCICLVTFTLFAAAARSSVVRPWRWVAVGLVLAVTAAQNPVKNAVFYIAPIVGACVWPWREFPWRRRLLVAGTAIGAGLVALVVYKLVLSRFVAFSVPRGHLEFTFIDGIDGLLRNLSILGRGLLVLCGGGGEEPNLLGVPGAFVMLAAFVFVAREALASRTFDTLRFVIVIVLVQLALVLGPVIVGSVLSDVPSVRYLMPSLLVILGLAAILAVRTLDDPNTWWRRLARVWLIAIPLTMLVALREAAPPPPTTNLWPDSAELERVADELVRRELTHGYSDRLAYNVVTLHSGGRALTCPLYFSEFLVPLRWLVDTGCFDAAKLPERFYVIGYQSESSRAPVYKTLGPPSETFHVGPTYEVHVYRTADVEKEWLRQPLPENDKTAFPLHIQATHPQIKHGKVSREGAHLVATGETGAILYGPYITLPRGRYTVTWYGNGIASPGKLTFYASAGNDVLVQNSKPAADVPTASGQVGRVAFKLKRPRKAIELVVHSEGGARIAIDKIVIERR